MVTISDSDTAKIDRVEDAAKVCGVPFVRLAPTEINFDVLHDRVAALKMMERLNVPLPVAAAVTS